MFKNEFQGGSYVEVFSAQGRDPVSKWRLTGTGIRKIFDKDVKSYVYVLEGESATTKMSIPKDEKQSLFLIQKYLVLQIMVPLGHSFSFELGVVDMGNNKRRVFLSSSNRELTVTPLHARFPLSMLRLGVWLNLCLDLNSLVGETFKGHTFKSIDSLTISANCHLRKIFTMKTQPPDTTNDDEIYGCDSTNSGDVEPIPKGMQFATSSHHTQVINLSKLRQTDLKAREAAGLPPPLTPGVSDNEASSSKQEERPTHIAFGSKVVIPKHARKSSREGGPGSAGGRSSSNSFNRSSSITHIRTGSPANDLETGRESSYLTSRGKYQRSMSETSDVDHSKLQLGIDAMQSAMQPRPPRTGSGNKSRRRPVRIRGNSGVKTRSAGSRSTSESEKLGDSTSSYGKPEGSSTERSQKEDRESDSQPETISRSQSENSLKASGNESSLGESFGKLDLDDKENQTHKGSEKKNIMFTFSSKPRSAPRSPRSHKRRQNGSAGSPTPADIKPDIEVSESKDSLNVPGVRDRKESEKSEYEEDFYRDSSESSDDDVLQKLLKSSNASRASSRASKHSPRSPNLQHTPEPSQTPHILRTSIKSSLLKEIPSSVIASKTYDSKVYQSTTSSWRDYQSDARSSWRFDTSHSSSLLDQSFNSSSGDDNALLKGIINKDLEESEDGIIDNDDGDSLTDDSDETCSTWKAPPPTSKHHRYQDEMKHPGPEPDMSATLPLDPRDYTDVFSPPIIMPSEKITNGQGMSHPSYSSQLSPTINIMPTFSADDDQLANNGNTEEMELDLLYDPCLNCYFDPKSHKYYELA